MKVTKSLMGMHITVEVEDGSPEDSIKEVFSYFEEVDQRFSTYKHDSEINKINRGEIGGAQYSVDMKTIFALSEQTKTDTQGFFNIKKEDGSLDPSGIVKGWAIRQAELILLNKGHQRYFIDAGGDIAAHVKDRQNEFWKVGIRNPFKAGEIIKVLKITNYGVATSGNYERGNHIYNPHDYKSKQNDVASITVVGPNILEADRFATAAFAMGKDGIIFIESIPGLEGYQVNRQGVGTETSNFHSFIAN